MVNFGIIAALVLAASLQLARGCQVFEVGAGFTPTQIDAAAFCSSFGIQVETCSDVGGGSNIGWLDVDDWVTWNIDVKQSGFYVVRYRVASYSGDGSFELSTGTKTLTLRDKLPSTGWWQNWETVQDLVELQTGPTALTLKVRQQGWNLNYIAFEKLNETNCQQFQVGSTPVQIDTSAFCSNYGVQVEPTNDVGGGTNVAFLDWGDWMSWHVNIKQSGKYIFKYRIASYSGEGSFKLSAGTKSLAKSKPFPRTGGWQNWITIEQEIELQAEVTQLVLTVLDDGFNVNWLDFIYAGASLIVPSQTPSEAPTGTPTAAPSPTPSRIPSKTPSVTPTRTPISLPVDVTVTRTSESPSQTPTLTPNKLPIFPIAAPSSSPSGAGCQVFEVSQVAGPTRIEADSFCSSFGVQIEPTSDIGGGNNVAFLDRGDWISWYLNVAEEGTYIVSYRIASYSGDGGFKLSTNSVQLAIKNTLPSTGGWQNWVNIRQEVNLSGGRMPLELSVLAAGFNIKWLEIKKKEPSIPSGFVKAIGQEIVGPDGKPLLLRGMGLGGWMVQEPYMLKNDFKGQYQFFSELATLMGSTGVADYQRAWLDKWMTLEDVKALKAAGFNSVRAAVHYNLFTLPVEKEPIRGTDTWIESGFARLDQLLHWCITEKLYLIIDLHSAPGGQGADSKISDYDYTKPSMWQDSENVRKSVALWKKFAARYANETWVAGYDLLNEPNWGFDGSNGNGCDDTVNGPLNDFYARAIAAIREVDKNHAIFIEGNCWGNNHKGLWPINDDNVVLSFHRYWIDNSAWTIQEYLFLSAQHQVPLWVGETGENSDFW